MQDDIKNLVESQSEFKAGQLRFHFNKWLEITKDRNILHYISGTKIKLEDTGIDSNRACTKVSQHVFLPEENDKIDKAIVQLLNQGVITKSTNEADQVVSNIFFRTKKDNSLRIILNIKKLNAQLKSEKFKMHSVLSAIALITPGCFMASIDLSSAYYSLPIHKDHKKYFKFFWNNSLYQYECVPNGLCQAPFIFTKITKPIFADLHAKGHLSTSYLDDSLLVARSERECAQNILDTCKLFISLGFTVHKDKSVLAPVQQIEYLGFLLNSSSMTITLTEARKQKLRSACEQALYQEYIIIRNLAKLIGIMVSCFTAIPYGKLYYRDLDNLKSQALKMNGYKWDSKVRLNIKAVTEINWWIAHIDTVTPMKRKTPFLTLTSDASLKGYGCVCNGVTAKGVWSEEEQREHINVLELKGAFFALKMFARDCYDMHVLLRLDSTTAIGVINNMGTCKSKTLHKLAIQIFEWCIPRKLWISATYISTHCNEADEASRSGYDVLADAEWQLNPKIFKVACENLKFSPQVDLFASRLNKQIDKFVSYKPDPDASFINAFTLDWGGLEFYAFPPFNLILKMLEKIIQDKGLGLIAIPAWKSQPFFALAMKMRCSPVLSFTTRKDTPLLICPGQIQRRHRMAKLQILLFLVSGRNF